MTLRERVKELTSQVKQLEEKLDFYEKTDRDERISDMLVDDM